MRTSILSVLMILFSSSAWTKECKVYDVHQFAHYGDGRVVMEDNERSEPLRAAGITLVSSEQEADFILRNEDGDSRIVCTGIRFSWKYFVTLTDARTHRRIGS